MTLEFWLATPNGSHRCRVREQEALFFLPESRVEDATEVLEGWSPLHHRRWRKSPLSLSTFLGETAFGIYFARQRDLYHARQLLRDHGIDALEADIAPDDRYLMERFVLGYARWHEHPTRGRLSEVRDKEKPNISLTIMSLDIETSMDGRLLYSIAGHVWSFDTRADSSIHIQAAHSTKRDRVFLWQKEGVKHAPSSLVLCDTERALLDRFLSWFETVDPDIIIGWSVIQFDLRFLQKKADQFRRSLNLGRGATAAQWRSAKDSDEYWMLHVPGRCVIDGIEALKSATFSFESFSLENVAREVLARGKLIHSVENRGEEITRLFREDPLALVRYNLEDCRLVSEIFAHTELLSFAIERSGMTGLPLDRFGGSVAAFDFRYLPILHRRGGVGPKRPSLADASASPGGKVMDSRPGFYRNVLVLDFKSLYPSIIRSFCVDPWAMARAQQQLPAAPETLDDFDQGQEWDSTQFVPGYRGALFEKASAILPDLIVQLWDRRDHAKASENGPLSQAIKILMNSFYGVLGSSGCRFFDPRLASSITLRGHEILNRSRSMIEEQGYEVIYGDTDSLFVWVDRQMVGEANTTLFEIGNRLAGRLNEAWRQILQRDYCQDSALELEFETAFSHFVMPTVRGAETGSKKRYAGRKLAGDGGEETIVFKGLEAVRTDWTPLAREFQRELYRRVFHEEPYEDFIRQTVDAINRGEKDSQLVYRKRLRRSLGDYSRQLPPHVQAALDAESRRQSRGESPRYRRGTWVEYWLTVNGPQAVECRHSPLDYVLYIERQIRPIVDSILQFFGRNFDEIAGRQRGLF